MKTSNNNTKPAQNTEEEAKEENTAANEKLENMEETKPKHQKKRKRKKARKRSPMRYPQRFLLHAIIAVILVWLMFGYFVGLTTAPNNDMYPRISTGDLLMYYRPYRELKSQDVVLLEKNNTVYLGRIIAVSGDTVDITDSEQLFINGSAVIEDNITDPTPRYEGFVDYPLTIGDGEYFILVDSRTKGEDSRYYGPVTDDEIIGQVITVTRRTNL